nr:GIY-YIG nuclease family protein [Mycolicibacterium komanii]
MVKIGLTRRPEPFDRVRELGDASVPFRFDVHTLFFADDAVTVETKLHQAFAAPGSTRSTFGANSSTPHPKNSSRF